MINVDTLLTVGKRAILASTAAYGYIKAGGRDKASLELWHRCR